MAQMVCVEIGDYAGFVVLVVSDDSTHAEIVMTPDEARGLVNNLGAAIKCASAARAGVMT
jgi:hypothetical protein